MISTYLTYTSYASDMSRSLARVSAQSDVSSATAYYNANIGKVKSVDDFMNNNRLFSYAMKAYGLEDMTYAKAFMKKVLTSDISTSDSLKQSFVGKLTDPRFLKFAQSFQFSTDGKVAQQPVTAQEASDQTDLVNLYTQQQVNKGATAADDAAYYQANIGNVTSVDGLINNKRLLNYALTAYGLDPSITSDATIKQVLTSDLSDPNSVANQLPNTAYKTLAAAFSFNTDGSINGSSAQSSDNIANTVYQYYNASGTGTSAPGAAFKSQYYENAIAGVTSVDDLLGNSRLVSYLETAFGLDPSEQSTQLLRNVLTSDLSDPDSFANTQSNDAYRKLAAAFNFNTDGSINGAAAQTAEQIDGVVSSFTTNNTTAAENFQNTEINFYKTDIAKIGSVSDFIKDTGLYDFVLSAFGIDPSKTQKLTIEKVLESDASDPSSFANMSHNSAYSKLAAAFNFDANGNAKTASSAQVNASLVSTIQLYNKETGDPTVQNNQTTDEDSYYGSTIGTIKNVDEFLKDKRLVTFALTAFDLQDKGLSNDTLRKILTSDPTDPKSYINKPENSAYRAMAVAFNFGTDGNDLATPLQQVQTRSQIVATTDAYARQTLEENAGVQNEGARLALYFQRMVPTITSAYSILADKALLQVAQTALGLPISMSNADIDVQANMITKKLKISDLQDPDKLNKFLARFSALYDVNNTDITQTNPAIAILGGG
ncbi:hypothetical protein HYPDE_35593 [Hyphomicrobium denitrificans 1NES1]|uniref:DUF1217 domain-containing protein n=1 Tax=Hyphomicrobium denitrificans 1NES1 TaxID=670307 RepID=N0BF92_9HYPH|nr:DUF1217 domain-containing protein [Hyphomicrobium denitrificans]AGK58790.1 hypothetical protein HYPDE_35593 [Hyphomicrobium denitrificans 1NES1]